VPPFAAIAFHECIPVTVSVKLAAYLVRSSAGMPVEGMIAEDIAKARARRDWNEAAILRVVLREFVRSHRETR
jgi:hypothetical protein